jgi:hypothetical protein
MCPRFYKFAVKINQHFVMRRILNIAFFVLLFVSGFQAQQGMEFEYRTMSSNGLMGSFTVQVSDVGMMSIYSTRVPPFPELPGMNYLRFRTLSKKNNPKALILLNDNSKTYSEQKISESADTAFKVQKLTNEMVMGKSCMRARITSKNLTEEIWFSKDFENYQQLAAALKLTGEFVSEKKLAALKKIGYEGVPLRMLRRSGDHEEQCEMMRADKKTFAKTDFDIPAGYTRSAKPIIRPVVKSPDDVMKMTPEARNKYAEQLKGQVSR